MNDAPTMIPELELEPTMNDADLDAALIVLRDSLGDLATLNNIIIGLRQNAARLMGPLTNTLHEARDAIDMVLTHLERRP